MANLEEAKFLLKALAEYDKFQFEQHIKPDYCNAGGLEEYHPDLTCGDNGWMDWEDPETGEAIYEIMMREEVSAQ